MFMSMSMSMKKTVDTLQSIRKDSDFEDFYTLNWFANQQLTWKSKSSPYQGKGRGRSATRQGLAQISSMKVLR